MPRISPLATVLTLFSALLALPAATAQQSGDSAPPTDLLRIGMIGLDTSHAPAFTRLINTSDADEDLQKMKVVAAYPGGSQDLPSSRDRVAGFTDALAEMGVEIVGSIEELLPKVDAILLESVDGRKHLEQALPVFKAGKPVFIDKPLAHNLVDAIAIDQLAKKYDARWFSSSSLRFSPSIIQFRENPEAVGEVVGASAWGPCSLENTHSDLTWYGVHGVETLYTAMNRGCQTVTRIHNDGVDLVVGEWQDGRVGTFRGIRSGKSGYGMVVFGSQKIDLSAEYQGYGPLVERVADFFLGGDTPVPNAETIEMFTFMEAADASKLNGGQPVQLTDVYQAALSQAEEKLKALDP